MSQALIDIAADQNRSLDEAVEIDNAQRFNTHTWIGDRESDLFSLAGQYNREQAARQALKNMDSALGQIVYTVARVNASDKYTREKRERTLMRLVEELQAEVDKYDTAANMDCVNAMREKVGRELVWLDVHRGPDVVVGRTELSSSDDAVSHLWNHVSARFHAWELERHYTNSQERRVMAQAVWHAAHDNDRPGATASAAFQAFQSEVLQQLQKPQPRPTSEIVILGRNTRLTWASACDTTNHAQSGYASCSKSARTRTA